MAFCTSCGATLDPNAQFCVKCGTRQAAGTGGATATAPPPSSSNSGLKIVLLIIAGIVLIGIIGSIITFVFIGKKLHDAKVSIVEKGDKATIVTPMGTIHTEKDPEMIKRDLGVSVYPGAKAIEGGSEVQTMGMHTVTGVFETSDPLDKVGEFYHQEYPKGIYSLNDREMSLVSGNKGSMVTISARDEGGKTRLTIVSMSGKGVRAPEAPDAPEPPAPPMPPKGRETN